ncbi:calcineurin-like phosphoesterase C-terminal domain-containing protein [Solilutibacter silvestris]|uniref:Calcineurin-like phosphoesterase n=1 Tax=Solilutibacter silvestris TaxID=1645665 RepID=A0A2K1PZZ1_9GAMM|nr:hypothetical protein Lysil_2528 [Lysobacter silvestris]
MRTPFLPFCLLAVTGLVSTIASAATMAGRVCLDPGNATSCPAKAQGVADVAISNGRQIVRSDAQGRYRIDVQDGDTVFVIKPATMAFANGANGLPRFWRHYAPNGSPKLKYGGLAPSSSLQFDVALRPLGKVPGALDLLLFGDPQPKSPQDVGYYDRDIVAPLVGHNNARLGISLGDIVSDDLSLYPAVNAVTTRLHLPWLHVPGNHDMDADADSDVHALDSFRNVFGPDTYAWQEQQANFIVLDDVVKTPGMAPGYIGGFRDDQFAFLQSLLPMLDRSRLLVLSMHIPLFEPAGKDTFRDVDRERLFALIKDFPHVLVLSAHSHSQQHYFHDAATGWHGAQPLHEYNVGAACGAFWSGVKDADGIPAATMADGTPNGYATLHIAADGNYALAYHPARDPADTQIGLHAPKVLRKGAYPAWGVYANMWMGMADTKIEYRVDDGVWKPMQHVSQSDPALVAENMRDDEAPRLRGYDRSPEATPSPHLWRGALPTDLAIGEHRIDVRAQDRWRGEVSATTRYRLEEALP